MGVERTRVLDYCCKRARDGGVGCSIRAAHVIITSHGMVGAVVCVVLLWCLPSEGTPRESLSLLASPLACVCCMNLRGSGRRAFISQ